jgi:hypothetical protein
MKPLTKLTFKSRYHPGLGLEVVQPIKLGNHFFQSFCEYENSGLDSEQIAKVSGGTHLINGASLCGTSNRFVVIFLFLQEIIVAFFKKDFPAGR